MPANENLLDALDLEGTVSRDAEFYKGQGCKKCLGRRFSSRIPIFEIMPITWEITMAIEAGIPHSQLQHIAIEAGMIQLLQVRLE